jgi:hypothetical protein
MEQQFQKEIRKKIALQDKHFEGNQDKRTITIRSIVVSLPHKGVKWARICVDEAQVLRNRHSAAARILRIPRASALHLMTATPALNGPVST